MLNKSFRKWLLLSVKNRYYYDTFLIAESYPIPLYISTPPSFFRKRLTDLAKNESSNGVGITTVFSSKHSIVIFVIAVILIIGLLFIFKTYKELSGETITVETEDDVFKAKQTIRENIEGLKEDVGALRYFLNS